MCLVCGQSAVLTLPPPHTRTHGEEGFTLLLVLCVLEALVDCCLSLRRYMGLDPRRCCWASANESKISNFKNLELFITHIQAEL